MSDFSVVHLPELEDASASFGLVDLSFRGARDALGGECVGLSLQTVAPGARQPFGHRHTEEEEIYVVLAGSGRMRLDDEEIDVKALDAIRVAPNVARAFEAGDEGLKLLAFGTPALGNSDGEVLQGWWGNSPSS